MMAVLGELILGWLLADLLTGIFHWWEDEYGREDWPLIGPWLIAPNRLHHVDPLAFTRHGFLARNAAAIITAGCIGSVWAALTGPSFLIASASIGGALANEVHRYAHEPKSARAAIRVLQEIGIIQSPKGHARHHRPPQDRNYCVLTDWLNPALEALGLWRALEALLSFGGRR